MERFDKLLVPLLLHSHFGKLNQSVFWNKDNTSGKFSVYTLLEAWLRLVPMKWGTRTQAVGGAKEGCGLWENCESRSRQQEAEAALAKHLPQAMQFLRLGASTRYISKLNTGGRKRHSRQIFMEDDSLQISQSCTSLSWWHRGARQNWKSQQPTCISSGPVQSPLILWWSWESRQPWGSFCYLLTGSLRGSAQNVLINM